MDSSGNAYVTGGTDSTDFPTTPGAFQTVFNGDSGSGDPWGDAFVSKLTPRAQPWVYSTYLGDSKGDNGNGIAADSAGNAYVAGWIGFGSRGV